MISIVLKLPIALVMFFSDKCSNFTSTYLTGTFTLKLREGSFPALVRCDVPRYLIEAAAGVYTGSVYKDKSILRAGHHGEARSYRDGSTLLQKTHHRAVKGDRNKVRYDSMQ